jgi:outer membrane protein OmpA-like peptidoglycan-associated protein
MKKRASLLTTLFALLAGPAFGADRETFTAPVGENTEFRTSLEGLEGPSNVWKRELQVMRDSAATLPTGQASQTETLSDADLGALFESGRDELLPASKVQLDKIADSVRDKLNLRFLVTGHADTQRLSARAAATYHDNQGLSEARAFQVAEYLRGKLGLKVEAFTVRGEGDLKPIADNSTPAGMAKNRRVELQLWYDQTQMTEVAPTPQPVLVAKCVANEASGDAPLRITIDGQPQTADDAANEADHQRCVDVAVNDHSIQIQFDPLNTQAMLNVSVWPNGVVRGDPVEFTAYSNYLHWIHNAELRFFTPGQDPDRRVTALDHGRAFAR